jgi:hypothetical protein
VTDRREDGASGKSPKLPRKRHYLGTEEDPPTGGVREPRSPRPTPVEGSGSSKPRDAEEDIVHLN